MPGLGTRLGRGGATTFEQDLTNSDCIVVMGSNMAENHPIAFRFAVKARERGARLIHVDPRFSRTSAMADTYVRIRSGTDIVFLGGLINYMIQNERYFKEYVLAYTNAAVLINDDFKDTEDLDGLFSGFDPEKRQYDTSTWQYKGHEEEGMEMEKQPEDAPETGGQVAQGGGQAAKHTTSQTHQNPRMAPTDPTLQNPRCVFQILKRHFARYTPETVADLCGCKPEDFLAVAEALAANSGRERTSAFCYAMGWTQHTVGVQMIGCAALLQLLLGNIGRPGGGILALRGHATIQGSTDIPTLYNLLPGYLQIPMEGNSDLQKYNETITPATGW